MCTLIGTVLTAEQRCPTRSGRIFPADLPDVAQARSAEPSEAADGWMVTNRCSAQPLS